MTYTFPPSLYPLRDYLKGQGADTRAFVSARQAAFMAQQLLGTRVKFPDKGADMTSTLFLIQKAVTETQTAVPKSVPDENAKQKKGGKIPPKAKSNKHNKDFGPERFSQGLHIFCDGACEPNPGAGGWGYAVYDNGVEVDAFCGGSTETTNNQMELVGLLNAIEKGKALFGKYGNPVTIWCDSQYCVKGVNEWMPGWKAKGWQRAGANAEPKNRIVMNVELWKAIDEALGDTSKNGRIVVRWVKGHAWVAGNERADELAEEGRQAAIERAENSAGLEMDQQYRQIMGAM